MGFIRPTVHGLTVAALMLKPEMVSSSESAV